jgi:3-hydroxy-9,10-secoandrosta-1,3,5(10)-triene-9,17-dione monooxygenase
LFYDWVNDHNPRSPTQAASTAQQEDSMNSLVLDQVTTAPDSSGALDRARELGELAWSHREETDRERQLPMNVIEELRASGLVHLGNQKRWGGAEADPLTMLDLGREVARGSGALGWLFSLTAFHTWYMAFTSEELQQEVWGRDHTTFVADSFAPMGKVDKVPDGYLLSGTWRFASGIEWAGWVAVGGLIPGPDGRPELQLLFLPRADVTVRDDWHTLGLRGTASRAVIADNVFVPEHRVFALGRLAGPGFRGAIAEKNPLWRVPLMTMQGLAVTTASIGISQRMIEEFTADTKRRVRWLDPGAQQRENPAAQLTLAASATQWDANWALAQKYAQEGWDRAQNIDTQTADDSWVLSEEERAKYFSWRAYIARSSLQLTDELYASSGAMALMESSPLQQVFRDMHAAGVHVGVDRGDAYTSRGRVALGFPGHPFH